LTACQDNIFDSNAAVGINIATLKKSPKANFFKSFNIEMQCISGLKVPQGHYLYLKTKLFLQC